MAASNVRSMASIFTVRLFAQTCGAFLAMKTAPVAASAALAVAGHDHHVCLADATTQDTGKERRTARGRARVAAVQTPVATLPTVKVAEVAKFRLNGFPQRLVDDPELGVFDDLPIVRRAEVRTATPGQRVFDEDAAPKDKAADVFLIEQDDAHAAGSPTLPARAPSGRLCRKGDHLLVESMGDPAQADDTAEPSRDLVDNPGLGCVNLKRRAEPKGMTITCDASSAVVDRHRPKTVGATTGMHAPNEAAAQSSQGPIAQIVEV